jgi:hypothetical protein
MWALFKKKPNSGSQTKKFVKKNDASGGGHKWTLCKPIVPTDHHQFAYIIKGLAMKSCRYIIFSIGSNSVAETNR